MGLFMALAITGIIFAAPQPLPLKTEIVSEKAAKITSDSTIMIVNRDETQRLVDNLSARVQRLERTLAAAEVRISSLESKVFK